MLLSGVLKVKMKVRILSSTLFLLLFCFGAATHPSAATLIVTKTADTGDGICDSDCSLREAVTAAVNGDTVVFSDLFNTSQTITFQSRPINIVNSPAFQVPVPICYR